MFGSVMHLIRLFVIPRISSSLLKPVSFLDNFGYLIYDFLSFLLLFLAYGKKCFLLHIFSPLTLCKTFVRLLGTSFYLEWSLRRNSNFSVCAEWLYRSEESSAAGLFENDVRFLSDSWVYSHLLRRRVTWLLWYSYKLKESGKLTEFCRTIIYLLYFINYIFSAAFAS